jgi:pimeloyl-ACP methyl ester carboxylesterase
MESTSETERVLCRNGFCIPYGVHGDPHAARRIVYAHGIHGRGAYTPVTLAPLIDRGWAVVSFDQRGHAGATPLTDPAMYDPAGMGADLLAILDDLHWERAWIGGESMGAATSIAAAFMEPERVEGLVQVVPAITDRRNDAAADGFPPMADLLEREGLDAVIAASTDQIRSAGGTEEQIVRLQDLRVHEPASLATIWRTVPCWVMPDVPGKVGLFDFPVLVAGWRDEPIHPFEHAEAIASTAKHGTLVEFDLNEWIADRATIGRAIADPLDVLTSSG